MIRTEGVRRLGAREAVAGHSDAALARSFDQLVDRRTLDRAYRIATLMLGNRAEAEEVTHDAAVRAWRRFGELRDPDRFDAWFGKILVNACRDRIRARRRMPVTVDSPPEGRIGDFSEGVARRQAIAAALRELSPEHREVVVLRFYADLTVDQIAAQTGARSGTVKSRLHYALRELRAALGDAEASGDQGDA